MIVESADCVFRPFLIVHQHCFINSAAFSISQKAKMNLAFWGLVIFRRRLNVQ